MLGSEQDFASSPEAESGIEADGACLTAIPAEKMKSAPRISEELEANHTAESKVAYLCSVS